MTTTVAVRRPEPPEDGADAVLLIRIAAGDRDALAALYDRFATRVYSLARHLCGEDPPAQDVVQDVFRDAWRGSDRFDPGRGPVADWLLTMTHHKAVDAVRRGSGRRRTILEGDGVPDGPGAGRTAGDAIGPGQVRDALDELPVPQRRALALAYYGGYTQAEVAAVLGTPPGSVTSRTRTAVSSLQMRLRPY